jgi:hypothetical protein
MPAEWDRQHTESSVETERKVSCARAAKPEMLAPAQLALIAIKIGIEIRRTGFCQEQLAFPQRTERNGAGGVSALMQHEMLPVFFIDGVLAESATTIARLRPNDDSVS